MSSFIIASSLHKPVNNPSKWQKHQEVLKKQKTLYHEKRTRNAVTRFNTVISILSDGVEEFSIHEREQYVKEIYILNTILCDLDNK